MKKVFHLLSLCLVLNITGMFAQTVTLTFTAKDAANHYVQLNRVAITNLTKSWQETIYWPDTTLTMQNGTGIDEPATHSSFALSQNNPNPFSGSTDVSLTVAEAGAVALEISDVNGRVVETQNFASLQPGIHQFRVSLSAAGTYVMTARQNGKTSSIKMVCNGGGSTNTIDYLGMVHTITYILKSSTTNPFNFGDMMEYVGYATINGTEMESQRITQAQGASQTFTLQFDAIPYCAPSVTTTTASNVTETSATCGGNVSSDGGANVIVRGVCYGTSQNPTVSDSHTTDGSGTGNFTSSLTGLAAGTTYYVRAYATNSVGTAYGNEVSFTTTASAQLPSVTTTTASNVTETSATCGGNVSSDGGANVIVRGVCYGTSQNPTVSDSHTTDGSGTGNFTSSLTGLAAGTTYYVRAYATNSVGTAYGNEVSFTTTASAQLPTVTTTAASNVTETSATCGGNITSDGGATVTARGVCWSTSHNPTVSNSHTSDGSGTGSFTSSLTGLTANTTYYVRAYATNSVETAYGNEVSFTTTASAQLPSVTTTTASNVTETSATSGGTVTSDGGANVIVRGVCYGTSQNPTTADSHTSDGSGTGIFTSSLTGLTAGTTYYVRAYATNSAGTAYGNEVSFTTLSSGGTSQDGQPCPGTPTVTDIDNNIYNTVQIGNQCWMKENLRTTHYADGTSIALGSSISDTIAYRYYPYHNQSIVSTYGYLYNWQAVMGGSSSSSANLSGVQGICPTGWHVPSDAEWTQMTDYVSSQSQYVCGSDSTYIAKALASTTGWNSSPYPCAVGNNQSTNNETGFSAFPAGDFCNGYDYVETYANFWCATEYNNDDAYVRNLGSDFADVYRDYLDKCYGLTVRCVRNENDSSTILLPTVTTSTLTNITANSATCGGNVISDGGATVTARGVCWSTSQSPTVNDSHTTDGSGTGSFGSSLTGLTVGTTYHVRAYATNSAGTAYGNEVILSLPCQGAATMTDIDNNIYNTVQIGNQCWMKENLRTTRYADGTSIALGSNTSITTAYRYYPDNNSSNVATYGYLYNWKAVMGNSSSSSANPSGVQGICPTGWHVPSDAEWTQLTNYVSSQSQYVCVCANNYIAKALASTIGWDSSSNICCAVGYDPSTNNETGFSALPAAGYSAPGEPSGFGYYTYFWSTTDDSYWAYCRKIDYNNSDVSTSGQDKSFGFSVRCIRDLPTVTTTAVSSIQPASATCGGNVSSDGGATVTARGVCWSTSQNPTIADSHTIDGNGMGIFTSNITNLSPATQYYVRAYATNIWGTAYGNEVSFITATQPCQGAATVTDIDNNTYNTVQIGNQCWMKENLRTTHYANGTSIPPGSTYSYTDPYRYYPNNDQSNVATYGYLYNWKAVMGNSPSSSANPSGVQGICPTGWHVPSDAEWTQLVDYVSGSISQYQYMCGSDTTYIAKALASSIGWSAGYGTCDVGNNPSTNNATGFSAFPAGHYIGDFYPMFGMGAYFWSATKLIDYDNDSDLWVYVLTYGSADVLRTSYYQEYGLSVRCLRNEGGSTTAQLPTVTTSAASNITANSATCGGNVTSDGGAGITARGVCWSTSHNPTVSNSHTSDGSGTGSFTSNLTGLTAGTTYYVRAYATNSAGTAYGNEVSFTTIPTQTQSATIILEAHNVWGDGTGYQLLLDADATAYGTIIPTSGPLTSSGDADANTYAAFEYKIPQNADGSTYTSNMVYDGSVTHSIPAGTYDYCITNPTPGDRIWIAASDNGRKDNFIFQEGYSYHFLLSKDMNDQHDTVSITVFNSSLSTPTVTTTVASNISSNSATCGGNVTTDGGATVTARGVCWSTSHNPTVSNSHTSDGSGTGSFTSNLTGLTAGTTYYVRAYATNSTGTAYGNEVSFTTLSSGGTSQDGQPCPGAATMTDIDGNVYNTVQIGNQCWMKENLKTTKYADGTSISQGSSTSSYDTPYWYYPNNNSSNKPTYGLLYNWKALMRNSSSSASNPSGVQGICPTGWHVPSYFEWTQLSDYVSSQSQWVCGSSNSYIAKALAGTIGWDSSTNTCAVGNTPSNNNATGFSALPAGNNIDDFGYCAYFWSATQNDSSDAYNRYLYYNSANVSSYGYYKSAGYSVRCVRNGGGSSTAQLPTVTTSAASNITASSATCGGNITSDGGATVTSCGVCWSTSQNPTVSDSHTSDGSGIGGSSGTGIFISNLSGLTANTTYYVRAYATNSAGTAYGSEVSFTTFDTPQDGQPCPGTATLTDYDGNIYNTVQIGSQCWMKENLRTTHYDDGQSIPSAVWVGDICHISYWDYEDAFIPIPLTRRGYLYNWSIVMNNTSSSDSNPSGVQGICPTGWHVPSYAEWTQLTAYVSSQSQYVCGSDINYIAKALASQTDWISFSDSCSPGDQSVDANNATGFSAVPAGMHRNNGYGYFDRAGRGAFFWTSTKLHNNKSYYFLLGNEVAYVIFDNTDNTDGLSVRCLKD